MRSAGRGRWFRGSISRCSHTRSQRRRQFGAALADGANPITEPGPWSASHTALSARMVVVLPDPAGPTSTSTRRPDVAIAATAALWSAASVVVIPRPRRRGNDRVRSPRGRGEVAGGGQQQVFGGQDGRGGEDLGPVPAKRTRPVRAPETAPASTVSSGGSNGRQNALIASCATCSSSCEAVSGACHPQRFGRPRCFGEQVPPGPRRTAFRDRLDTNFGELLQLIAAQLVHAQRGRARAGDLGDPLLDRRSAIGERRGHASEQATPAAAAAA